MTGTSCQFGAAGILPVMSWEHEHCSLQSTMLREVWTRLYQLAHDASNDEDSDSQLACLNKRILSSLKPDKTMVFVLDLMRPGRSPTQHVVPSQVCIHLASVE